MNLEIHKPELVQRVNAQIQIRHLRNADELIEQALDALDEIPRTGSCAREGYRGTVRTAAGPQSRFQP
ncbi:MAG TPA: hypothetical protein VG297_13235 [Bryobacteraceae bacterium]|jgi:hypothetical protein|nr:hypothetical protein [Bryobacteraceae bacterium]